jgi:hypothetical protein
MRAEMFTTSRNVAHVDQHFRLLELWALHREVVAAFPRSHLASFDDSPFMRSRGQSLAEKLQ